MEINVKKKPDLEFRAFYVFFLIASMQIGVGILGVPRIVYLEAEHDGWISILLSYFYIVLVVWTMVYILRQYKNADILGIQVDLFGKWIGKILGTIYLIYFTIGLLSILITYIEVVKVYIFPDMDNYILGGLLLILAIYTVLGGIRIVVGVCFIFFFLTQWVHLLEIQPILNFDILHFQPVLKASFNEIVSGAKSTSYTMMGFELLFFIYPFIQNKQKTNKATQTAIGFSTAKTLVLTVVAVGYFSASQLTRREWPVLDLYKLQTFSFLERFDYVIVAEWMMVVIPNIVILMWLITYSAKRLFQISQKTTLYIIAIILFICTILISDRFFIQKIIDLSSAIGFWIVYVYPFLLLPWVWIKNRSRKRKGNEKHAKA